MSGRLIENGSGAEPATSWPREINGNGKVPVRPILGEVRRPDDDADADASLEPGISIQIENYLIDDES